MRSTFIVIIILMFWAMRAFSAEQMSQRWLTCANLSVNEIKMITVEFDETRPAMVIVRSQLKNDARQEISVSIQEALGRNLTLPPSGNSHYRLYFHEGQWQVMENSVSSAQHFTVNCVAGPGF